MNKVRSASLKQPPEALWRLVVVFAFLGACFLLARYASQAIVDWMAAQNSPSIQLPFVGTVMVISAIASGVSLATLIAMLRPVLFSIRDLYGFVAKGRRVEFPKEGVTIVSTFVTLGVLAGGPKELPPVTTYSQGEVLYLTLQGASPEVLATFPLVFGNARLVGNELDTESEDGGVIPTTKHKEELRQLLTAFAPCAGLAPASRVRFRVDGYASSKEFAGVSPEKSLELNLNTANLRGSMMTRELLRIAKGMGLESRILAEHSPHLSEEQMANTRPYNDRPRGAAPGNPSELLNRAVMIKLLQAGECDLWRDSRPRDGEVVAVVDE